MKLSSRCVVVAFSLGQTLFAQLPPAPPPRPANARAKPKLVVVQRNHDLGTILEGDKYPLEWRLENNGDADLIIDRTRATCGCTVVKLSDKDKVLHPGDSFQLSAIFDSTGRHGKQDKAIVVYSNDPVEPELKLRFLATIDTLYAINPAATLNIRAVRRGQKVKPTIEISPMKGRGTLEILGLEYAANGPVRFSHESFTERGAAGQRIKLIVADHVPLGALTSKVVIKMRVDGFERERTIRVRGRVIGDLTWSPQVIDETRHGSRPGRRFAPVDVRTTNDTGFDIVKAPGTEWFDVEVEARKNRKPRSEYRLTLTVRERAPIGPFGAMLEIHTTSLDQPVIRIPVYGLITAPVEIDPPIVMFRQDGTDAGTQRRVKLQVPPQQKLQVLSISCDRGEVTARVDEEASARYGHIRFLSVRLSGTLPSGTHEAVLTVGTNISGADHLEIPVRILVP